MINFNKKILIIGFGSVSQCTVPVLFKHINVDYSHVTIMDFEDIREKYHRGQHWALHTLIIK